MSVTQGAYKRCGQKKDCREDGCFHWVLSIEEHTDSKSSAIMESESPALSLTIDGPTTRY